jgi:enterochelin esterase-like enzyme
LAAIVLVPEGFDAHTEAHYPLIVFHDHFASEFSDIRETPPDPDLKPDYSDRFHLAGYNRIQQQEAYKNYQAWIAPGTPRMLIVKLQHANPYYDDSYAVNSANLGPYGDAIETELIPAIEQQFRGIGQGWARFVYGGSTGGWESLAVQMFYPDHYNGAFVACPDPVDFHAFISISRTTCSILKAPTSLRCAGTLLGLENPASARGGVFPESGRRPAGPITFSTKLAG